MEVELVEETVAADIDVLSATRSLERHRMSIKGASTMKPVMDSTPEVLDSVQLATVGIAKLVTLPGLEETQLAMEIVW